MKFAALGVAWIAWGCGSGSTAASDDAETEEEIVEQNLLYGIPADDYRIEHGEIAPGETMGRILNRYGVGAATVDRLDRAAKTDFPLDGIRAGNPYTVFIHEDSLNTPHLDYLVYERNASQYVVFGLHSVDSVSVTLGEKPVSVRRQKKQATIDSSLWGRHHARADALCVGRRTGRDLPMEHRLLRHPERRRLHSGLRRADHRHDGRRHRARLGRQIHPCRQGTTTPFRSVRTTASNTGTSTAAVCASNCSKRRSNIRASVPVSPTHACTRSTRSTALTTVSTTPRRRGTPVRAVADGVVTFKGWGGGGGNTLKIKHPGNMMSGYLHLSRFAKGIAQGSRVSQGQLIGYVGSTGASTGPHLDFRLWRNGKPIDPLKAPSEPAEPIAAQNRAAFEFVRDRIVAELDGEVSDSLRITQLDSIRIGQ